MRQTQTGKEILIALGQFLYLSAVAATQTSTLPRVTEAI